MSDSDAVLTDANAQPNVGNGLRSYGRHAACSTVSVAEQTIKRFYESRGAIQLRQRLQLPVSGIDAGN